MAQQGIFKSFKNFTQWTILLVLLTLAVCPLVFAQLPTATILGVAKDSSGSVVPDVNVTARNIDTGQTRTTMTDANGSYRLPALPVGNYEVRAEKTGFQAEVQSGLTLVVGQEAVVNVTLQVGSVSQTVSVTAEAPLVNTTSGSLGGLVNEEKMADLPLNGRNYIDLTLLQAGVSETKGPSAANVSYTGTYFVSNGATVRSNNYLLDGASLVNLWGASSASATGSTLGVDGIKEYKVITNSFSAEYGLTMGSQMTIVSKGGTNAFHGDVFEYLRNSAMDARNFFDKSVAANNFRRLPEFQRNNFGGSFGGPIRKDKTFFYGVFEGVRQRLGITTIDSVMPASCHNTTNIVDVTCDTTLTGGATITVAPVMQALLAQYPSPNIPGAGLTNNYTFPYTQPSTDNYGQMRFDQTLSDKDSMFVRYTVQNTTQAQPTPFPQFSSLAYSRNQFLTLSESRIISPTLLNTLRGSFSRTNLIWSLNDAAGTSGPAVSFVQGLDMGDISITGLTTIGAAGTSPRLEKQNIFTGSDDVFYTRGHHAFKFGALVNHYQQMIVNSQSFTGVANFVSITGATPYSALGAFLAGQAQYIRALTPGSQLNRIYHFDTAGVYAQDDWKVLPRLTLNLGLRYEFDTTPNEMDGHYAVIKNLATDTGPVFSTKTYLNNSLKNFSPRLGFAWDVMGNGKTAVRGGFDYLYDLVDLQTGANLLQTQIATPPFSQRLQGNNINLAASVGNGGGLPFQFPASTGSLAYRPTDWNLKQPAMLVYNLAVERQLPFNMSLSVAYAGSQGRHLMAEREGDPLIPQGVPGTAGGCVARPAGQAVNLTSMVDNGSATACWVGGDPRVNSHFGSTDYFIAANNSSYNALQVGLIKQLSKGLQLQSSYTWSKAIDNNTNITGEFGASSTSYGVDPFHPNLDRSPSLTDVTNVWKINAIYQLPKMMSSEGVASKLLNGWWVSSIVTLQSGLPFTPALSKNISGSGVGGAGSGIDRPDLLPGRNAYNIVHGVSTATGSVACPTAGKPLGGPSFYFDPCAFAPPTAGFLGTAGRDMLRGPGFAELDSSLVKDTKMGFLGESGMLEIRAEVFNITNHPNYSQPARVLSATNTGSISTTSGTSRQVQLALKILF